MGKCSFTGELNGLLFGGSSIRKMASAPAAGLQLNEYQWEGSYLVDHITSPTDTHYFSQGRSDSILFYSFEAFTICLLAMERKLGKVRSYLSKSLTSTCYIRIHGWRAYGDIQPSSLTSRRLLAGPNCITNYDKIWLFSSYTFKHQLRVYLWCLVRVQTRSFN